MDVVPIAESKSFDFTRDTIEIIVKGSKMMANRTTLGADNGLPLVASMQLMEHLQFPANLHLLMTADEEDGLKGVKALDTSILPQGPALCFNIDSESSHQICTGSFGASLATFDLNWEEYACIGGCPPEDKKVDVEAFALPDPLPLPRKRSSREPVPQIWQSCQIQLSGAAGGHSGMDIDKDRLNTIQVLSQIVDGLHRKWPLWIHRLEGGQAPNAIPTSASCWVYFSNRLESLEWEAEIATHLTQEMKKWQELDSGLKCHHQTSEKKQLLPYCLSPRVLSFLLSLPSGVLERRGGNLFLTSNLGTVKVDHDQRLIQVQVLSRSANVARLEQHHNTLGAISTLLGECKISPFATFPA